jgi:AraC-like DNA-binding protein
MSGASSSVDSATDMVRLELSCGSFDALRAVHFSRAFPPHFHETFAIGVVEAGLTRIHSRHGHWIAGPGAILAFAPGEIHSAEPATDAGYTFRMVYPPAECMREIGVARGAGERPTFRRAVVEDAHLGRQLRDAHTSLTSDGSHPRAESLLSASLRLLMERHATDGGAHHDEPSPRDIETVRRAQQFLHERHAQRVRLAALADVCRLSPFQVIRIFRRVLGVPPFAYLLQVRVNRAQGMLRDGSSLADVAYSCGFSDQSHLTRAFKRVVGIPPGQYMRSVRPAAR